MDSITSFFISSYDDVLNVGFVCNLMLFLAVINAISLVVGAFASMSRD